MIASLGIKAKESARQAGNAGKRIDAHSPDCKQKMKSFSLVSAQQSIRPEHPLSSLSSTFHSGTQIVRTLVAPLLTHQRGAGAVCPHKR